MLSVKDFVDAFHATGVKPMRESFKNESCSAVCAVTAMYLKEHGLKSTQAACSDDIASWFVKEYGCSKIFCYGLMNGFDDIRRKHNGDGDEDYENGYKLGKEIAHVVSPKLKYEWLTVFQGEVL